MTMREKLITAVFAGAVVGEQDAVRAVDAIIDALMWPSEEMADALVKSACVGHHGELVFIECGDLVEAFRAAIQAIREGK
jgi:hypothetical protein